jgi:putative Mg2+ transporter-C (MgtC) family protein
MDAHLTPTFSILLHIAIALALGWAIGYERYFHGRSAGTQIYCLVCMAACALTCVMGYPSLWYGGGVHESDVSPTAIIASIVTGIGFLGAGIIVKSGTSIRGLSSAASIWSSSAIGILVGLDFVVPAAGLTALFIVCMALLPRLERHLPAHVTMVATIRYAEGKPPQENVVIAYLKERQLRLIADSLSVNFDGAAYELHFAVFADSTSRIRSISQISQDLEKIPEVSRFSLEQTSRA